VLSSLVDHYNASRKEISLLRAKIHELETENARLKSHCSSTQHPGGLADYLSTIVAGLTEARAEM
jgi:hypothetical protein